MSSLSDDFASFEPGSRGSATAAAETEGARAAEAAKGAEGRVAPRFTLLLRTAKLIVDGLEFLCVLRDASDTGVKVRIFHPLPSFRTIALEIGNGERHPLELVWTDGEHAGFRFTQPIAVKTLINEHRDVGQPRRPLRLRAASEATLHAHGELISARLVNLSQQGACVECDQRLMLRERIRIDTGILPVIYAKVCWRQQPRFGLVFEQGFQLDEFARHLAVLHATRQGASDSAKHERPAA